MKKTKEISQEDIDGLDYLVFVPGRVVNEVISVKGNLITNIRWDEDSNLIADHAGVTEHFEVLLNKLQLKGDKKLSPEAKHAIYRSVLKPRK